MTEITLEEAQKLQKTQANKIRELIQKQKTLISAKQKLTEFQEPVMMLVRKSGQAEFYEKATKGRFDYTHSDGTTRFIILTTSMQISFPYAGRNIKMYYCHEDYPFPLPGSMNPIMNSDELRMLIEKSQHDTLGLLAKEKRATGDMWLKIFAGIALIIVAVMLYKLLVPAGPAPTQTAAETAKTIVQAIPINSTAI